LGAVAPTPLLANEAAALLAGQEVSDQVMGRAAAAAQDQVRPITDMRGTAEFRRHLTGVLTRRVLGAAVVRARGEKLAYHPGM
jgi:xanthine dehydrogenase FAD-binding subunit